MNFAVLIPWTGLTALLVCLGQVSAVPAQNDAPPGRTATITVQVPAEAEVWIDNHKTTQQGAERVFVSPRLGGNAMHYYDIRARWRSKEGAAIERGRRIYFRPGEQFVVDFQGPGGTVTVVPPPRSLGEGHVMPWPETGPARAGTAPGAGGVQPPAIGAGSSAGFTLPGTGTSPSTSGYSPGLSAPPGGGVFPSTSGISRGMGGNSPGTGVFPSTSGYRGR